MTMSTIFKGWKPGAWKASSWGHRPSINAKTSLRLVYPSTVTITAKT